MEISFNDGLDRSTSGRPLDTHCPRTAFASIISSEQKTFFLHERVGSSKQPQMVQYQYRDAKPTYANAYLWPALRKVIGSRDWPDRRAFDLGCGNGATCGMLSELGFAVTGVDESGTGIEQARSAFPKIDVHIGSVYDDLAEIYGTFPLVISLEVVEHCFDPRSFAKTFLRLIARGGVGFLSTPYHSYLKNLALAASGKMDSHFTVLWDGGHVKFFSMGTLDRLLRDAGAESVNFMRVGRIPILAKSMIALVRS